MHGLSIASMSSFLQLLVLCGAVWQIAQAQHGPVVSTKYGYVEGESKQTDEGKNYDEFRGIPFAAPPEGDLRWQKPMEPAGWEGIRHAKEYGPTCAQVGLPWTKEDCLYLNVYVPDSVEQHIDDPIPVMVWIYGGAFIIGSGKTYNGQLVSTRGRVVFVTVNYRVGVTGFLSTFSEAAPGNYGLWDQVAALRWVQENIASFGGDPNSVTIIGQSAGGISISNLALSPAAKGLFHRVLALSGSAASFSERSNLQRTFTVSLARHYQCPVDDDTAMVACLKNVGPGSLNLNGLIVPSQEGYSPSYRPVVDQDLIAIEPLDAMALGRNADYDLLAGRTLDDGSMFSLGHSGSVESFRDHLLTMFKVWENNEELVDMVFEQYPNLSSDDPTVRDQAASQMTTDFRFGLGAFREVEYHSQNTDSTGKKTFFYEFDYSFFFKDSWISGMHTEDVFLFFGDYSPLVNFDGDDNVVSRNLQAYYCNFAYTGNPNEGPHSVPTEWPQYDVTNKLQMRESENMTSERVSDEVLARYNWWIEVFYPAAVPVEFSSESPTADDENARKFEAEMKRVNPYLDKLGKHHIPQFLLSEV